MNALTAEQFAEFFQAASLAIDKRRIAESLKRTAGAEIKESPIAKEPFPWQERVAAKACMGEWPDVIALPTAAGKTGCIDIAVYALACRAGRGSPRRIFFVVDRRIVVDQARRHAAALSAALDLAPNGILRLVADQLRELGNPGWLRLTQTDRDHLLTIRREIVEERDTKKRIKLWDKVDAKDYEWVDSRPLDVYALRGGMYRETAWARTPLQPTIIASTVDQVGSRLLFRGYGVSDSMRPIHAGLVGNDALILLDEAHCSRPFVQTADAITKYREWTDSDAPRPPFRFVQMTATPFGDVPKDKIERDQEDDRRHPIFGKRFHASKPAKLVIATSAQGKSWKKYGPPLVAELKAQAQRLMGQTQDGTQEVRTVGIIVNRVATARALAEALKAEEARKPTDQRADVIRLTGRMRPVDRDAILERLEPLFTGRTSSPAPRPTFVVATQCLEVGADLDFHGLVTECASLDALRQRFGRLNRDARTRTFAPAVIVIRADQTEGTLEDLVYGASLAETWMFLRGESAREEVDFGIAAMRTLCESLTDADHKRLNSPAEDAPVLFPAHLDCWVQTAPVPALDPDPAPFLHGPTSGVPDVQVVIRADLGNADDLRWAEVVRETVRLCPPSSSEALPVPIDVFRRWLADAQPPNDESGDTEGERTPESEDSGLSDRRALRWKGPKSDETKSVSDIAKEVRPGDTFVVSTAAPDLDRLGDFEKPLIDYGDAAFRLSRDKPVLRLTQGVVSQWPEVFQTPTVKEIVALVELPEDEGEARSLVNDALGELVDVDLSGDETHRWKWLVSTAESLRNVKTRTVELHPCGGMVLTGRKRLYQFDPTFLEDDDSSSEATGGRKVTLEEHSGGVAAHARMFAAGCGLPNEMVGMFATAGYWHDLGKLDRRFQAMLQGRSPWTAGRPPLAKSEGVPKSRKAAEAARAVHKYPSGGRHELLSAALVAKRTDDDLLLHLIATHHGTARPFAPPVEDLTADEAGPFAETLFDESFMLASSAQTPAVWNATLPDRFWRVIRRFGWWGSAYMETIFRLADHTQSRIEQEGGAGTAPTEAAPTWESPSAAQSRNQMSLPLIGLDGSNPLAFLAALGTLRALSVMAHQANRPTWLSGGVRLAWGTDDAPGTPVLHLAERPEPDELCALLADRLARDLSAHPMNRAIELLGSNTTSCEMRKQIATVAQDEREHFDWLVALYSDAAPEAASQLQMVRRDYLIDNLRSVLRLPDARHYARTLFQIWDYADPLSNQSLHWDPSEDRRHAYQWNQPSGDPTRNRRGGMLGANRLAIEAWPLFSSIGVREQMRDRMRTRGFSGTRSKDTNWTWPIWAQPLCTDSIASLLALSVMQCEEPRTSKLRAFGVTCAFRSQRILVNKTPNLTPGYAV